MVGVGFFAGIQASAPDIAAVSDSYFKAENLMDFKIVSTMGLTDDDVAMLQTLKGVQSVIPSYSLDVMSHDKAIRVHAIEESVNNIKLVDGRMPKTDDECVADSKTYKVGDNVGITSDVTDKLKTTVYTVVGTMINLAVTLTAAYSLSKKFVPGGRVVMLLMIFTMYFSGGMIPTYMIMKNLNLLDTRLIMVVSGAVSTYNLIIARTFFISGVPKEVEEAALIDGCSIFRTFISIVLPLSKAVIGVLALYYGVAHWNSYFNALIYLSDNDKYPLQLIQRAILISNQQKASMALENEEMMQVQQRVANLIKYSVIVVSSLPVLVAYPFLQKYFAKGVMVGSVKG
jgi:putative aldouronate transport system permease protein